MKKQINKENQMLKLGNSCLVSNLDDHCKHIQAHKQALIELRNSFQFSLLDRLKIKLGITSFEKLTEKNRKAFSLHLDHIQQHLDMLHNHHVEEDNKPHKPR